METQPSFLKSLRILFSALLLGQLFFLAIAIILFETGILEAGKSGSRENIFTFMPVAISIFAVAMSYRIFAVKLEEAKKQDSFEEKTNSYRGAYIMQLALCEGPAIFTIICYFITGNHLLLIWMLLLLANFVRLYPSKSKIIQQLELDDKEESMLE